LVVVVNVARAVASWQVRSVAAVPAELTYVPGTQLDQALHALASVLVLNCPYSQPAQVTSMIADPSVAT
jgi:hypothetical protein